MFDKEKKVIALEQYKNVQTGQEYKSVKEICSNLGISRTMLYYWLQQEGLTTNRRGQGVQYSCNPSKTAVMAEQRGVTYPTARKYITVRTKILKQGFATLEDLRNYGITCMKIKNVQTELRLIGIEFNVERKQLNSKKGEIFLDIKELLEVLSNPRKFLFENSVNIIGRWK